MLFHSFLNSGEIFDVGVKMLPCLRSETKYKLIISKHNTTTLDLKVFEFSRFMKDILLVMYVVMSVRSRWCLLYGNKANAVLQKVLSLDKNCKKFNPNYILMYRSQITRQFFMIYNSQDIFFMHL